MSEKSFHLPAPIDTPARREPGRGRGPSTFSWTRRIDGLALFAFAAGVNFLFGYGQQRALGIAMVFSFLLANLARLPSAIRSIFPLPPEVILYSTWVVWAGLTGYLVAVDKELFLGGYLVLLQVFAMVLVTYAILINRKEGNIIFWALLVGGVVQIVIVFLGLGDGEGIRGAGERVSGLARNPNSLGFLMIWTVLACAVFWRRRTRFNRLQMVLLLGVIILAVYTMLASGSRKSAIAMAFLLFGWATFAHRQARGVKNIVASVLIGGVLIAGFVGFLPELAEHTTTGQRFQKFLDQGRGDLGAAVEQQSRFEMYIDGFEIFLQHPFFGVGLNNFQKYFYTGHYSHSDYMEPLATTGLLGFLLYQSFYFILLFRMRRLLKVVKDSALRYRLRVMLLGLVAIMIIGIGAPHYTSSPVFLLLTAMSVFTFRLQRQLQIQQRKAEATASREPASEVA